MTILKLSAALLMSYFVAVNSTNTINTTSVRSTLKAMGRIETFACPIDYYNNGTNKHSYVYLMQNLNGQGQIVEEIVYPADFNPSKNLI